MKTNISILLVIVLLVSACNVPPVIPAATFDYVPIGAEYRVAGTAELFDKAGGKKQVHERASELWGKAVYYNVDQSTTVRAIAQEDDWVNIAIINPEYQSKIHMVWLRINYLIAKKYDAEGVEIISEDEVLWRKETVQYKSFITRALNKTLRDNSRCERMDLAGVYISQHKGTKGHPVFWVACYDADQIPFNVFFCQSKLGDMVIFVSPST
jgi:hypothetical protein